MPFWKSVANENVRKYEHFLDKELPLPMGVNRFWLCGKTPTCRSHQACSASEKAAAWGGRAPPAPPGLRLLLWARTPGWGASGPGVQPALCCRGLCPRGGAASAPNKRWIFLIGKKVLWRRKVLSAYDFSARFLQNLSSSISVSFSVSACLLSLSIFLSKPVIPRLLD